MQEIEAEMGKLSAQETEMRERIAVLEGVSLPAVDHLVKLTAPGERKSAWRDYVLFVAGMILSTIIAVVLGLFGLT